MKPLPLPTPEHLRSAARMKSGSPHRCRSFLRLFAREPLHFCANCGNIIRQYCFCRKYALVAQPVEHLTFNQRARDSSSLERTKIPRRIVRFLVGFSIFWGSAHFCTLFAHRRESRVFPCIVCILCIVSVFSILFQANSRRVNSRRCSGFICRTTFSIPSGVIWMLSGRFSFTGTEPDLGEPMSCE